MATEQTQARVPGFIVAADNHNIGNTNTSWLDPTDWGEKLGNVGKFSVASIISGANSFYRTGVSFGNFFGAKWEDETAEQWISAFDSDLGQYYKENQREIDTVGFVAGSLIPGIGGVKIFNAGQKALMAAEKTGFLGGNLSKATGLLTPNTEKYVKLATEEINSSVTSLKILNTNTAKALGAGFWQNTLEAAAFETAAQITMARSPVLENQDLSDIFVNIGIGGALGGVIGGAFNAAKVYGTLKTSVREELMARFPFISRPGLSDATPANEKILFYAYDMETAAVPYRYKDANGEWVNNNFAVNKTLYEDKIAKNLNSIRTEIHKITNKGDSDLANIVATTMTPLEGEVGYANRYLNGFAGAKAITRVGQKTKIEELEEKFIKMQLETQGIEVERTLAPRYIKNFGEGTGEVSDTIPTILNLADIHLTKDAIFSKVKGFGFKVDDLWDVSKKLTNSAHFEAEARYIWAEHMLPKIPKGARIHGNDIPLLERAYKDNIWDEIEIISGEGPTLSITRPGSRTELYEIIKTSKQETANKLLYDMSLKRGGHVPVEVSTEKIAKMVNTRKSYLEGTQSQSEYDDLFANQSAKEAYFSDIKNRIGTASVSTAVDPMLLPKYTKIVYEIDQDLALNNGNIMDAITLLKEKQKLYVDTAKNVVSKNMGNEFAESLPDISDTSMSIANIVGESPGLVSSANSNYGSIGSTFQWIGSITRAAGEKFKQRIGEELQSSLVALGTKQEAALEFESINQKVTRSAQQWKAVKINDETFGMMEKNLADKLDKMPDDFLEEILEDESKFLMIQYKETFDALQAHISTTGKRITTNREIRAAQGHTDDKDPDVFRPIRPDPRVYKHFAFVKDPAVTGTGHTTMIFAASEKELGALMDRVPPNYKKYTKSDGEEWAKAWDEYEYSRTLHENYIDSDLKNKGVYSNFFPKSNPEKIVDDILQQNYRESDVITKELVRLRYEPQFNMLEDLGRQYSKIDASQFATRLDQVEKTANNPYFNYIKTALNISKINEHPLIYSFNKALDDSVSKMVAAVRSAGSKLKSSEELSKLNSVLDEYGMKPAYYDASLHVLANHTAPRGELTKFVRGANSILSLFTLGLDHLNSLVNVIGSNVLRPTELKFLTDSIKAGNTDLAGELGNLAKVMVPGTPDSILSPSKLIGRAIKNYWDDDGTLLKKYKDLGYSKDRIEQLKILVDDFTLKGTESVKDLDNRMKSAWAKTQEFLQEKGERFTFNKFAEEFNRFISANIADQLTTLGKKYGLMDEAASRAYINTFVNRVEGNMLASQRPMIFQGPVGQAIGLFQSYQFNLMQQLFRYVGEGRKKDVGMLLGLQSTLFGLQGLPAFQFVNTHIVGRLSGNTEHRDIYDTTYGAAGRNSGDWLLYGIPSNMLQTNIYSRGDINPRQLTVLPTNLQEIPIVAGWAKFFGSMYETTKKIAGGGNIWESLLQGIEHNGISRPLAGLAQTLQSIPSGEAYSTSSKGSILYSNDLMSLATLSRLAGGRPLDEAIVNDATYRVQVYAAARHRDMEKLAETIKTTMIKDETASDSQIQDFAQKYAELGGKQAGFNKWMMQLYKGANVRQAEQLQTSLSNPFAYKMQLLMGGEDE